MHKIKKLLRRIFAPITIMLIPHSNKRPMSVKLPSIGIIVLLLVWTSFTGYIVFVGVTTERYNEVKAKLDFYYGQFADLRTTINSLKKSETQFKRLFSLEKKSEVLETLDVSDSGSIDMELLKKQIEKTMDTVGEIKDYLRQQRDIYFATPRGSPLEGGYISSPFGWRKHPKTGRRDYHTGIDIAAWPGTPVRATADGIVSFAGWSGGSGRLVVLEHGFGFTTAYAHNKKIIVKVGQKVNRGDIISYVGSTGNTTGPHVHYEVWLDKKPVNPRSYMKGK
ncbi:murein DD-endopeptidase MepM [bacterium BMS3Bbin06]|nr:murein DD-endopeptidase MepM [bacterium BMS3Abin08]GBE34671.1 murein DD-endopeptidase MepM [bacterium BMS3Bbin06]HDO35827.1 M23 family metallopeptidase [Nitrospirota bacterium]HDY70408.1 M23 family metallopeptidase [Nitrospirota bacterium]